MDISTFADQFKLKIKRDNCDEYFIPCRRGQIYDHGNGQFAVMVIGPAATPRTWSAVRRTLVAAGFTLHQDGDSEGTLSFDPDNAKRSRLAIRVMGARRVKQYSSKDRERRAQHLAGVRWNRSALCENRAFTP